MRKIIYFTKCNKYAITILPSSIQYWYVHDFVNKRNLRLDYATDQRRINEMKELFENTGLKIPNKQIASLIALRNRDIEIMKHRNYMLKIYESVI